MAAPAISSRAPTPLLTRRPNFVGHCPTSTATIRSERALLLEPDPKWLAEGRRLGQDRFDEVWDGVLSRAIEAYVLVGDAYELVKPDGAGIIVAPRFDLRLSLVDGPKLRVAWTDGPAEI